MGKLRIVASIVLALAAAAYSSAQRPPLPDHFGKWSAVSPSSSIKPENTQEELLETGFVNSLARTYSDGDRTLTAAVYQFRDPSSAYEIYTSALDPNMLPSTVGNNTAVGGSTLVALTGNLVVRVWPVQNPSTEELRELMKSFRARSEQTPLPPIRSYLPQGFTDGTQRYALGAAAFRNAFASLGRSEFANLASEAGFGSGAEAMFAQYRAGKDEAVVLLIEYPTPQLAEQHLRHL